MAVTDCLDTDLIRFDPTAPIPELTDPNLAGLPLDTLSEKARSVVTEGMASYLRGAGDDDRALFGYRQLGARYGIEVVLPDGRLSSYRFDIGPSRVELVSAVAAASDADVVHRIAASALLEWIEHRKSFFYVRGWSRRYQAPYLLDRQDRELRMENVVLPDLLMHYITNVAPGSEMGAKRLVDNQLAELGSATIEP